MDIKLKEMNLSRHKLTYDTLMAFLAFVVIFTLFFQNKPDLTMQQLTIINNINFSIWLIFVIDYVIRFALLKNKVSFVKNNIIDLVSIFPFENAFQALRAARILRIIYMIRAFAYLNRLYQRVSAIIKTNDFNHVLWFTFATIFCGAIAISYIDDMPIGDALWWSFVTTTTVGYGDIAPSSFGGRIIAIFLMIIGIGFLSMLTGTIATYFIKGHESSNYTDEALKQIIGKLENFSSLTVDEINTIHSVLLTLKNNQNKSGL
jgi:Ion channel.